MPINSRGSYGPKSLGASYALNSMRNNQNMRADKTNMLMDAFNNHVNVKQHPTSRKKGGAQYASIQDEANRNAYRQNFTDNNVTSSETKETSAL